jgi:hypothetical protein
MENNLTGFSNASSGASLSEGFTSTSMITFDPQYSSPEFIRFEEFDDRLEFIYTEEPNIVYTVFPPIYAQKRCFKIVYSCVDGKWNKSDKIYGKIIPATKEDYEF